MSRQLDELDELWAQLCPSKVAKAAREPPKPEPVYNFDAGRFRWLFGTLEGIRFLNNQIKYPFVKMTPWGNEEMTPKDTAEWRGAIDRAMGVPGAPPV